ncbi:hypothetical protein DUNSADRAFT_9703 [Dunaliella salina]|uniref:Uncharacterized protein n=1 Tax=Dunaliella salina TaxID=3046 RepID=A0ABQ7GGY7_DUNSA|nr:hypothetical protein DUNSADRAFT_9703 [Dunaliella salina]|eukprot:KAF5833866.1 hypothetical protein DUNSADRAFT_9703 [Dunaliella salina]
MLQPRQSLKKTQPGQQLPHITCSGSLAGNFPADAPVHLNINNYLPETSPWDRNVLTSFLTGIILACVCVSGVETSMHTHVKPMWFQAGDAAEAEAPFSLKLGAYGP